MYSLNAIITTARLQLIAAMSGTPIVGNASDHPLGVVRLWMSSQLIRVALSEHCCPLQTKFRPPNQPKMFDKLVTNDKTPKVFKNDKSLSRMYRPKHPVHYPLRRERT